MKSDSQEISCWRVAKPSVFSTHPFTPLNFHLEGQIPVYIVICKSTSKNVCNKMSCYTITSHWNACSTTPNYQIFQLGSHNSELYAAIFRQLNILKNGGLLRLLLLISKLHIISFVSLDTIRQYFWILCGRGVFKLNQSVILANVYVV